MNLKTKNKKAKPATKREPVKKLIPLKQRVVFFIGNYFLFFLPIYLLLALQPLSDWIKDKKLITFPDIYLPLALYAITALILTGIFYWFFLKNRFLALVFTIGFYFAAATRVDIKMQPIWNLLRSWGIISKIFDSLGIVNQIIFALIFAYLFYYLFRLVDNLVKSKKWDLDVLFRGALIAIAAAFLIQGYSVVRTLGTDLKSYRPAEITSKNPGAEIRNKPDIYYIILDRYTNQNSLQEYFGYDDSDFINFLKENDFSVEAGALSNYPITASSIASTMKADYHDDLSKKFKVSAYEPYYNSIRYSPIIKALKREGYSYHHIGSWYDATTIAPLADHYYMLGNRLTIFNSSLTLNNFPAKELAKTIWWQPASRGIKVGKLTVFEYTTGEQYDWEKYKLEKLNEIADDSSGPKFVLAHILVPHPPFVFNADGSPSSNPEISNYGMPIKQKYTSQVKFISDQTKELIGKIRQKTDNQAVIIIQADEGPYPTAFKLGPDETMAATEESFHEKAISKWTPEDIRLKWGILAAYNVPEANPEDKSKAENPVNIFRLVLNTYFDYGLPYLPNCYYTVKGKGEEGSYDFLEISEKLTGSRDPACPAAN